MESTDPRSFSGRLRWADGGAGDDPVAAERVGQHVGEHFRPFVLRGGEDGPELAHGASLGRQTGDIDQQAAEQLARCFCPMGIVLGAGRDHEHLGHGAGEGDDVRIVRVEGIEPVHAVAGRARDAEGIDEKNVLAGIAAGAGGDGIVLALEVEDEGRARIIEEVRDDGADAFTGAGGRTGEDVAVLPKATIRKGAGVPRSHPRTKASAGADGAR